MMDDKNAERERERKKKKYHCVGYDYIIPDMKHPWDIEAKAVCKDLRS